MQNSLFNLLLINYNFLFFVVLRNEKHYFYIVFLVTTPANQITPPPPPPFLRGQFLFLQKTAKKFIAPNCAPIFDTLPRAQKSKLGRTKKYTPGELLIDFINTKSKLEHPKRVRTCAPKLQFETAKN